MRLFLIHPLTPVFRFFCLSCHQPRDSTVGYADVDGAPFTAYYCAPCAATLKEESKNGR